MMWPDVHFGTTKSLRLVDPPPDLEPDVDDELLAETPADIIGMLGFDPLELLNDEVGKIGTAASGNRGHAGVLNHRGGSAPGTGSIIRSPLEMTQKDMDAAQANQDFLLSDVFNADGKENKKSVESRLADRLSDNVKFTGLAAKMFGPEVQRAQDYEGRSLTNNEISRVAIRNLISTWAATSGDHDPYAISLQMAAKDLFGGGTLGHMSYSETYPIEAVQGSWAKAERLYKKHGEGLRSFIKAQYDETQSYLAEHGIKELVVCRGVGTSGALTKDFEVGRAGDKAIIERRRQAGVRGFDLQPISSCTLSAARAYDFASYRDNSTVLFGVVPAKQILSLPSRGFGCTDEQEVTVLSSSGKNHLLSIPYYSRSARSYPGNEKLRSSARDSVVHELSYVLPEFGFHLKQPKEPVAELRIFPGTGKADAIINLDADLEEADWAKHTWDVDLPDFGTEEFNYWLEDRGMTLEQFKKLPVYRYRIATKHYGPGPHKSGSPQSVHGGLGHGDTHKPAPFEKPGAAETLMASLLGEQEGFSYQPVKGIAPKSGFMVSTHKRREKWVPNSKVTKDLLNEYMRKNSDLLVLPDHYAGGWRDTGATSPHKDQSCLDVSMNVQSREKALRLAEKHKQDGVYDVVAHETVYTKAYLRAHPGV